MIDILKRVIAATRAERALILKVDLDGAIAAPSLRGTTLVAAEAALSQSTAAGPSTPAAAPGDSLGTRSQQSHVQTICAPGDDGPRSGGSMFSSWHLKALPRLLTDILRLRE